MSLIVYLSSAILSFSSISNDGLTDASTQAQVARFNVVNVGPQVEISWVSLKEENAGYFTIERSSDGVNFLEITRVSALGDSPALLEYFESDRDPLPGVSYYRLKQTTKDGEYFYSDLITVKRHECGESPEGLSNQKPMDAPALLAGNVFGGEETLVIVRDKSGNEFYSKVILINVDGKMVAYDPDGRIVDGEYTIVASSNDELNQRKVKVD